MRHDPLIIILNGTGSVGKTSVANEFQKLVKPPFLKVHGDSFMQMLPVSLYDHPDGISVERENHGKGPIVNVVLGDTAQSLIRGFRRSVGAMATEGNNLIVDDLMLDPLDQAFYREILSGFDPKFVGLNAPLSILEEREQARGDRLLGLARWQFDRVHDGKTYDFELDTSQAAPFSLALAIAGRFGVAIQ